jgi:hypothetical protein
MYKLQRKLLPHCHTATLHFKGVKYLKVNEDILKYHAVIIWLYAHVVGLVYILLVCWFFFGAVCS